MKLFKDISISRKLYWIVGAMAILIAAELFTLWFAINTLSSVRALVGGEGLYSKAQKDGIYKLVQYAQTHNESDYAEFIAFMKVPLGDHKTRVELIKSNPDINIARAGFLEGRIHASDIDGIIKLLRRFHNVSYIKKAIGVWSRGDSLISELIPLGDSIHTLIQATAFSGEKLNFFISKIDRLNHELTLLEDDFSYTLGEGSRWLENFILKLLFSVALTVEITGLVLTILVSRSITKGLNEIIRATNKISKGDLTEKAAVYSRDEIGQVATAVNTMTSQLINSNNELSRFAYIASHDLQEPLRTISSYASLYRENYQTTLDAHQQKYLDAITDATQRMQLLIKGILDYAQVGQDKTRVQLDIEEIVDEVLADMAVLIKENNVEIIRGPLPEITGYPEIRMLFQNIIGNAIKFRSAAIPCKVKISSTTLQKEWRFAIQDNGIGIEKKYHEQIFAIFQKLHSRKSYPGTGIGLAHSLKIVELHGGKIWVESEPGKGSTFYFTIPKMDRDV